MGFNMKAAIGGAGKGAALGGWGAVAGGLMGGFMGGDEPELYSQGDYMNDMGPYRAMMEQQMSQGKAMQDPRSAINRQMQQGIQEQTMDQMGVANMMSSRQNASNPFINSSGIQGQQQQNNMLSYANQGLGQYNQAMEGRFNQGMSQINQAQSEMGTMYQTGAEINMGNVATMNEYNQGQTQQMMGGMGDLMGGIGGSETFKKGGLFGRNVEGEDPAKGYLSGMFGFLGSGQ